MAEKGYVYHRAGMTAAERDQVLTQVDDDLQYVIHHSVNQIHFDRWRPAQLAPSGQAFGPALEVRWWPQGDGWEMLVLGEVEQTALQDGNWHPDDEPMDVAKADHVYLWGEHWQSRDGADRTAELPEGWVQAQIEAKLNYPLTNGVPERPLVQAIIKIYRLQGIARLTRFVDLVAVESKEGSNGTQTQ